MAKEERTNFLERLIGKKLSDEIKEGTEEADQVLDAAGVTRKDVNEKGMKEDVDMLAETALASLSGLGIEVPENAQEVVSGALAKGMLTILEGGAAEEVPVEEPPAEMQIEEEEEGVVPPTDEEEDEDEIKSYVKAIVYDYANVNKEVGAVAQLTIAHKEQIEALEKQLKENTERLAEAEKLPKMRPRQASRDEDTIWVDDDLAAKMKESLDGEPEIFAGLKLKPKE